MMNEQMAACQLRSCTLQAQTHVKTQACALIELSAYSDVCKSYMHSNMFQQQNNLINIYKNVTLLNYPTLLLRVCHAE